MDRKFDTFLQYEVNAVDPAKTYTYIYDSFLQPTLTSSSDELDRLAAFLMSFKDPPSPTSNSVCVGILIGGEAWPRAP